jgi:5-methylcytosine-specific restriction enzyme subunit McrC
VQPVEGLLLYPVVRNAFRFEYRLHGHRMRVATIDLDQPWQGVHRELLGLV